MMSTLPSQSWTVCGGKELKLSSALKSSYFGGEYKNTEISTCMEEIMRSRGINMRKDTIS